MADYESADPLYNMAPRKVRITLTLSSDIMKEVDRQAALAKVSRSAYIEEVLRQYLRTRERHTHIEQG
jgi:metal-responsive CopG/Arc/MetJ family transcriptional regulator